jgi:hypothetical protein
MVKARSERSMANSERPAMKPTVYIDSPAALSLMLGGPVAAGSRPTQASVAVLLGLAVAAGSGIGFAASTVGNNAPELRSACADATSGGRTS